MMNLLFHNNSVLYCPGIRSENDAFKGNYRALYKRGYLMIIEGISSYFSLKPYVVTPHLNRLDETVRMRGHYIYFMHYP